MKIKEFLDKENELIFDNLIFTGVVEYCDGFFDQDRQPFIRYLKDGKGHRENRPAVVWFRGTKYWMKDGLFHRTDGPAAEYLNGEKGWYLNGKAYSEEEWRKKIEKL